MELATKAFPCLPACGNSFDQQKGLRIHQRRCAFVNSADSNDELLAMQAELQDAERPSKRARVGDNVVQVGDTPLLFQQMDSDYSLV